MASWSLRARGPAGQATISGVDPSMSLAAFQQLLQEKLGVAPERQEILAGFPPRPVQLPAEPDTVSVQAALPIANGDSLTVRELPAPITAPAAQQPSNASNATSSSPQPETVHADEDADLAAAIAASLADQLQAVQPASGTATPTKATTAGTYSGGGTARVNGTSSSSSPSRAPAAAAATPASPLRASPGPDGYGAGRSVTNGPAAGGPAPTHMEMPDGCAVTRRVIDSDNSCLFNAVGYVMDRSRARAGELRRVISSVVASDPLTYNDAFLGMGNEEYCRWITDPSKWGGAIELSILAAHYKREIAAYDIQTERMDLYGQDAGYGERVMLLYDGLHYDAMAVAAFPDAPEELDVTIFDPHGPDAPAILEAAKKLVAACHKARQFTDTANFTLRCGVCQIGLKGEKEAVAHAKVTGHQNFTEY